MSSDHTRDRDCEHACRPRLEERGVKLIAYDDDKSQLSEWADVILGDKEAAKYVWGLGLHWYTGDYLDKMTYGVVFCAICVFFLTR
jgi:O-glycosyl hydrolase